MRKCSAHGQTNYAEFNAINGEKGNDKGTVHGPSACRLVLRAVWFSLVHPSSDIESLSLPLCWTCIKTEKASPSS